MNSASLILGNNVEYMLISIGNDENAFILRGLHNIIELQNSVWRRVDQHVGQCVLMIIHFICKGEKERRRC